jgi:hypothetical protein
MENNIIDIIIEKVKNIPNDQELGLEIRKEISLYKEKISQKVKEIERKSKSV